MELLIRIRFASARTPSCYAYNQTAPANYIRAHYLYSFEILEG